MKKYIIALLILFTPLNIYAQSAWQPFSFFDNAGGLNDGFAPTAIADNEAAALSNVVFTTSGNFKERSGSAAINTDVVVTATALSFFKPTSGNQYLVAVSDDGRIYKMDYAVGGAPDGTWDNITGSLTIPASQDADDFASFAVGEDTLLIEDGMNTTAPYKWAGSGDAAALGGSPPNCTMIAFHKDHAFCAGNNSNPSTLYFSDKGNIEDWSTGLSGNLTIQTNDGTVITAIRQGFDALYIWKGNENAPKGSIWRLSGDDKDNFELQRMISDIGTVSPQSIGVIGSDFIFMDGKGNVYIYDGAVKLKLISAKIEGTRDSLNFTRFDNIAATVYDKDYYASVSTVGSNTNNRILVFDTFNLAWTVFEGIDANAMTVADNGSGKDMLVTGSYTGIVFNYPEGTNDGGTAINSSYTTKQFRFPELSINKTFHKLYIFANQEGNYNLSVEVRKDFGSTGTTNSVSLAGANSLYGTAIYGTDIWGGQNLIVAEIEPSVEGQFFQLKFSNANLNEPWEVKGWNMYLESNDEI